MESTTYTDHAVIGGADPLLAAGIRECASKCLVSRGALTSKDVEFHGWTVNVLVRSRIASEDVTHPILRYRVMLRVNLQECPSLPDTNQHATLERMVDRFLLLHEHAINVLVLPWKDKQAPFKGLVLRHNQVAPTDSWVGHINTSKDGLWRCSHWMVVAS